MLKMTLPGMPDFYRGTELWDFNLVDPDNRRPVDYDARRHRLKKLREAADKDLPSFSQDLAARWPDPDVKLWITSASLHTRRELPEVFANGDYIPLSATGAAADHVLAFARRFDDNVAICVVPRHLYRLSNSNSDTKNASPLSPNWGDTTLVLPEDFPSTWLNRLTGQQHETAKEPLSIADLFKTLPVALLTPSPE